MFDTTPLILLENQELGAATNGAKICSFMKLWLKSVVLENLLSMFCVLVQAEVRDSWEAQIEILLCC
jgi:hypothetical protein